MLFCYPRLVLQLEDYSLNFLYLQFASHNNMTQ